MQFLANTNIDFIGKRKPGYIFSIGLILVGMISLALHGGPRFNIDFEGGPPIHYLLADAFGNAALFEHYQGEIYIYRNQTPWHQATNLYSFSV